MLSKAAMLLYFFYPTERRFFYNDKSRNRKRYLFANVKKKITFDVKNVLQFWWGKFNQN